MNNRLSFFGKIPIKRKLMIIIMFISSASLLLACVAMLLYERRSFRQTLAADFAIIADTFDDNLASGLALLVLFPKQPQPGRGGCFQSPPAP